MMSRLGALFDPLVRLLLLAILLASVLPVTGEGRAVARIVSDGGVFILFLLNGLRLPRRQVLEGTRNWRFLLPLVLFVFGGMSLAAAFPGNLAAEFLPASMALGFVFLGALPSTVQSATAYSSIAGGNVTLSVVAAAVLNILGVFISAPLVGLLASSDMPGIDLAGLERIALILLLPFVLGQVLQGWLGPMVSDRRQLFAWLDRIVIATAVYVAFSGAVEQGLWSLISLPEWGALLTMVGFMLAFGFFGAWWLGGLLRLDRESRVSFLFAGAQKSIAMGAPLASILFPPEVAGLVLLPLLVYHLLQMVISAPVAARFSRATPAPHPGSSG